MLFRPNRLLTLRNFIPKKTNQVARAKGIDFVGAQQASPNLLILAAPSGAGKTHLIHALANFAKRNDAIHSVTCLSATQFADEIVRAEFYRDKELQIQRFAQEDLLALDDVDRLFHQQVAADTLLEVLAMRQTRRKRTLLTAMLSLSNSTTHPLADFLDHQAAVRII